MEQISSTDPISKGQNFADAFHFLSWPWSCSHGASFELTGLCLGEFDKYSHSLRGSSVVFLAFDADPCILQI